MSRLGNDSGAQRVGSIHDSTPRVVAGLLRSRAEPLISSVSEIGDVRFAIPIRPSRITRADLLTMPMVRTYAFVDFLGEYLVRRHFRFFEPVILRGDYERMVKTSQHQHFGFWFNDGALIFQCHASVLNRIFNQELKGMLTHETVENS